MISLLVTYDVETSTPEGRHRLRKVAQICLDFGQRVQMSVFECLVDEIRYLQLISRLEAVIDTQRDSLRVYRLPPDRDRSVTVIGKDRFLDFTGPIII